MTAYMLALTGIIHGLDDAYERDDPKRPGWVDDLEDRAEANR